MRGCVILMFLQDVGDLMLKNDDIKLRQIKAGICECETVRSLSSKINSIMMVNHSDSYIMPVSFTCMTTHV